MKTFQRICPFTDTEKLSIGLKTLFTFVPCLDLGDICLNCLFSKDRVKLDRCLPWAKINDNDHLEMNPRAPQSIKMANEIVKSDRNFSKLI